MDPPASVRCSFFALRAPHRGRGGGPRPGGPGPADRACGWGGDRDIAVVARACVRVVVRGHWLWRRVRGALARAFRDGRVRAGAGIVSLGVELMLRFCLSAFLRCLRPERVGWS